MIASTHFRKNLHGSKINFLDLLFHFSTALILSEPILGCEDAFFFFFFFLNGPFNVIRGLMSELDEGHIESPIISTFFSFACFRR